MKRWNQFWFSEIDPLPLGVCRICLGTLILIMYIVLLPNWARFYAADGIMSLQSADLNALRTRDWWSVFELTGDWLPIHFYWWIGALAAVFFLVGWQTRLATIVLFVMEVSMIHRAPYVVNGEDLVFRMMLLYACFAPCGHCLSVDSWLRHRRTSNRPSATTISAWPVRLMQVNIALIYLISLPYKISQDFDWATGDALHWTVASDLWWVRGFLPEITYGFGGLLRKLMTWGTVFVEGTFSLFVCFRRTRLMAVAAIASLHIGIAILVPNVTLFTLSMVASVCVFLPPQFIRATAHRLPSLWNLHLTGACPFHRSANHAGVSRKVAKPQRGQG